MLFLHLWGCPRLLVAPGLGPGPRSQGRQQGTPSPGELLGGGWSSLLALHHQQLLPLSGQFCITNAPFALFFSPSLLPWR